MSGQFKSVLAMSCAVLLTAMAVWGIRWANDIRHNAAEIAALGLKR